MNILVVEDEEEIADLIEIYLRNEMYSVTKVTTGFRALEEIALGSVDLVVLDVMLPDMDGFKVLQEIRKTAYFPVIMLTARVDSIDKINGLTIGADDYMTKPFDPLELVARVKTQFRRMKVYNERKTYIDVAGLHINCESRLVLLNERRLQLTKIEYEILLYLAENAGKVISAEELFEQVWQERYLDNNNTVMAHIARLREKMGERSKLIKTVWGVGYIIE